MAANVNPYQQRLTQYQNQLNQTTQQLEQLSPYYQLWSMMSDPNQQLQLPPGFAENAPFIQQQASAYQKMLQKKDQDANLFNTVKGKYDQFQTGTGGGGLAAQSKKMSSDIKGAHNDVLEKIAGLGDIFGTEKNELVDRINAATEQAKRSIAGESQEEMAKAEGLTTRRGQGTKAMENISKAGIQAAETKGISEAEQAGVSQIQQAVSLYNQLLKGLLDQYKATKDTYVLGNIQNVLNVLSLLKQYGESSSGGGSTSGGTTTPTLGAAPALGLGGLAAGIGV